MERKNNRRYKALITQDDTGKWHGVSYSNQQIPLGLMKILNDKMHEAIDEYNGDLEWRTDFYSFVQDGVRYRQYVPENQKQPCEGCCFRFDRNGVGCQHPHYLDGLKGVCNMPYKIVEED